MESQQKVQDIILSDLTLTENSEPLLFLRCPALQNFEIIIENQNQLNEFFQVIYNEKKILNELKQYKSEYEIQKFLDKYFSTKQINKDALKELIINQPSYSPQQCISKCIVKNLDWKILLPFIAKNQIFSFIKAIPHVHFPKLKLKYRKIHILHQACAHGDYHILEELDRLYSSQNKKIAWNLRRNYKYQGHLHKNITPFLLATKFNNWECINFLINKLQLNKKPVYNQDQYLSTKELGNIFHIVVNETNYRLFALMLSSIHYKYIDKLLTEENSEFLTPSMIICQKNLISFAKLLQKHYINSFYFLNSEIKSAKDFIDQNNNEMLVLMQSRQPTKLEIFQHNLLVSIMNHFPYQFSSPKVNNYENLVLAGGGNKGIAYFGALRYFAQKNQSFKRIAGTSAGAITAGLMAVGYQGAELEDQLLNPDKIMDFCDEIIKFCKEQNTEFQELLHAIGKDLKLKDFMIQVQQDMESWKTSMGEFLESNWFSLKKYKSIYHMAKDFFKKRQPINQFKELFKIIMQTKGLCKGKGLHQWIEDLIEAKTGIKNLTYGQLRNLIAQDKDQKYHHLYVCTTKLNSYSGFVPTGVNPTEANSHIIIFNTEDPIFDKVIVSDTIRASMSLPLIFQPFNIHCMEGKERVPLHNGKETVLFVDGGLIRNFPVNAFDYAKYSCNDKLKKRKPYFPVFNENTLGLRFHYDCYDDEMQKETKEVNQQPQQDKQTCIEISTNDKNDQQNILRVLFSGLLNTFKNAEAYLSDNYSETTRVIKIKTQATTIGFKITPKEKEEIIQEGYAAVKTYFEGSFDENLFAEKFTEVNQLKIVIQFRFQQINNQF